MAKRESLHYERKTLGVGKILKHKDSRTELFITVRQKFFAKILISAPPIHKTFHNLIYSETHKGSFTKLFSFETKKCRQKIVTSTLMQKEFDIRYFLKHKVLKHKNKSTQKCDKSSV